MKRVEGAEMRFWSEREPGGRGIGKNGLDEGLIKKGKGLFGGAPGAMGNGFKSTKSSVDASSERFRVSGERQGSVKGDSEETWSRVED